MAGQISGVFREKISPFLKKKLTQVDERSADILERQYRLVGEEKTFHKDASVRHYHAESHPVFEGQEVKGVERLYRRTMLVEPTTACAAHCRWCLRGLYPTFSLSEEELVHAAKFIGQDPANRDLRELLITGGDPLMVPDRLGVLLDAVESHAPQIKIVRIGTRVPLHAPERVGPRLLRHFEDRKKVKIEIATHVNSHLELFPECIEAYEALIESGCRIYNQNVLLKGINDRLEDLVELYDHLRYMQIESHYLFHCIPMKGMEHHRTSIAQGIELIRQLANGGYVSGRVKPMFTAMTDLGKITLYDGVIRERKKDKVLLKSSYQLQERLKWNPDWEKGDNIVEGEDGYLQVWYLDGAAND